MEVLNQNQRRSAYWRIFGLTVFTLVLLMLVLYSTYDRYVSQGVAEITKMQKEHNRDKKKSLKTIAGLKDNIKMLTSDLKKCQDNIMNNKIKNCLERLEGKEKRREELEEKLEKCEKDLKTASSF